METRLSSQHLSNLRNQIKEHEQGSEHGTMKDYFIPFIELFKITSLSKQKRIIHAKACPTPIIPPILDINERKSIVK